MVVPRSISSGLVVIVFLWTSTPAFAGKTIKDIDLPQAINYALAQNRELVRSALAIDSSALGVTHAKAGFQISVRPGASVDFSDGTRELGYGLNVSKKLTWGTELSVAGKVSSEGEDDDRLHQGNVRLEVQQPIFRNFGPSIHREPVIQATNSLKSARRRFEMQKADLVLEVVATYENILRLKHQVRSDEESFKRMDELYRLTQAKEVLGRTTRIDTLRVELLRGQALFRLEANKERLSSIQRDFAELLGFPLETVFDFKPTSLLEFDVPQPEEAVKIALQNRLDYAQVLQDHEDTARSVHIARRKLLPDLKLIARHERVGEGLNASDARGLDESIWFVGIAIGTDLNLTRERSSLGQARINRASALETIKIVELSIARQVLQRLQAYRRAQAEVRIARQNFELTAARAKLARRLFELGRGDSFSATDAEESYLEAENQFLSAQAEASISCYRLSHASGTLIEVPVGLRPEYMHQ